VCAFAQPGQILTSNVIRELCLGKSFVFSDIGEVELKGFTQPLRLHEVRWSDQASAKAGAANSSGLSAGNTPA